LALTAATALLVSGALLVAFFRSGSEVLGRANDATTALFAGLMIPVTVEVYQRFGPDSRWAAGASTLLGILGLMTVASTSALTAAARLHWLLSAKIGGVGFAGFLIWMGAVCVMIVGRGGLPRALAWFGFVVLGIAAVAAGLAMTFLRAHGSFSGDIQPSPALSAIFALAYLCFPTWIGWLGVSLIRGG
jgi:hypothetical protein